jgi:hypothetical protein
MRKTKTRPIIEAAACLATLIMLALAVAELAIKFLV